MKHRIYYTNPINDFFIGELISIINQAMHQQPLENKASEIEIHFSSRGGDLHAGFTAYNFLRSLPIPLHIHNIGSVESIAVILYLAADKRTACEDSRFMLHNLSWVYDNGSYTHNTIIEHSSSLDADKERYLKIFEERTNTAQAPVNVQEALVGSSKDN